MDTIKEKLRIFEQDDEDQEVHTLRQIIREKVSIHE